MLMIPNFFYSVSSLLIRNRTWAVRLINIHLTLIWHSQTARRTKKMKLGVLPCLRYHSGCMHKVLENKNKAFYHLFWSTFSEYCTFLKTYKEIQASQVCVSDTACCPVSVSDNVKEHMSDCCGEGRWDEVSSGQAEAGDARDARLSWGRALASWHCTSSSTDDGLTSGPWGQLTSDTVRECEMQQWWQIQRELMGAFSRGSVLSLGSFISSGMRVLGPAWGWCPARPGLGELWVFVMKLVIHLLQTKNHRCVLPLLPFIWYQQCRLGGANGCSLEIISVKCFIVMLSAELILKVHFIR